MSWRYKDPRTFSAIYPRIMREAAAQPHIPTLFTSSLSREDLEDHKTRFRWFRWCIRQKPGMDFELTRLEETFDYRVSLDSDPFGLVLYLTARPTKLGDLFTLNPDLARTLPAYCQ